MDKAKIRAICRIAHNPTREMIVNAIAEDCIVDCQSVHDTFHVEQLLDPEVAVLLIDNTPELLAELEAHFLSLPDDALLPSIVLFYTREKVGDMVQAAKFGVYDAIKMPTFKEEVHWVVNKAITDYQLTCVVSEARVISNLRSQFLAYRNAMVKKGVTIPPAQLKAMLSGEAPPDTLEKLVGKEALLKHEGKVLVIEDEAGLRAITEQGLLQFGYEVLVADSVEEARDMLVKYHPIDLVLLDLKLHNQSGEKLIPEIKGLNSHTEIIIVTAFKDMELILKTIRTGAFDYLVKGKGDIRLIHQKLMRARQKQALRELLETDVLLP